MYNVYHIFRDLRQFLLIVTLTPEVLLSNLQLYTSSFLFTCRFYQVFGRYLLCCVRIGLDWIHILGHQLDWTGLGSVARGFGLDWIVSPRSISYSDVGYPVSHSWSQRACDGRAPDGPFSLQFHTAAVTNKCFVTLSAAMCHLALAAIHSLQAAPDVITSYSS